MAEGHPKIVLIGPAHPYRGGIAHFMGTMVRGLNGRGYTAEAVTFTRQYPELLFPGKTQFETHPAADPIPAQRLIDSINPLSWRKAGQVIATMQPDVVVFQYWMPFFGPAFGTIARRARKSGAQVLAVVHNALPHERRAGDMMLSRYFFKAVDGCIVLSDAVREDLQKLGVDAPVQQVAHPVYDLFGEAPSQENARQGLGLPQDTPVLLFFGFIRRYKGLHVLLEAMPRVLEQVPDARLMVAGEFYGDEQFYHEQIKQYGLADAVLLHSDYIPQADVGRYFAAADVVVQPYVTATQSGVAQIAFHFDKPIILTDVGGLAEIVPHERAGLVVPPENPEALSDAIVRFFKDNMADHLVAGVREEKKKYSWDRLYEAVEALMEAES